MRADRPRKAIQRYRVEVPCFRIGRGKRLPAARSRFNVRHSHNAYASAICFAIGPTSSLDYFTQALSRSRSASAAATMLAAWARALCTIAGIYGPEIFRQIHATCARHEPTSFAKHATTMFIPHFVGDACTIAVIPDRTD
jgi:hypothetical protein